MPDPSTNPNADPPAHRFLTTEEVAELLRISPKTLRDQVEHGAAPPHFKGGGKRLLFPRDAFETWVAGETRKCEKPRVVRHRGKAAQP